MMTNLLTSLLTMMTSTVAFPSEEAIATALGPRTQFDRTCAFDLDNRDVKLLHEHLQRPLLHLDDVSSAQVCPLVIQSRKTNFVWPNTAKVDRVVVVGNGVQTEAQYDQFIFKGKVIRCTKH